MISANDLAACFEEILGWPYASPGVTDDRGRDLGIDCSGAFVRAYKKHGLSIYHGSNTIFRRYCGETGRIEGDAARLRAGMAVFKRRDDGQEPAQYRGDGHGNLYHIGLVTRASPLRIVHATTPAAKADSAPGQWAYYGRLKDVDYEGGGYRGSDHGGVDGDGGAGVSVSGAAVQEPGPGQAKVITTTSGLTLRKRPDQKSAGIKEMPAGTIVTVLGGTNGWAQVRWDVTHGLWHVGWCRVGLNGDAYLKFGQG